MGFAPKVKDAARLVDDAKDGGCGAWLALGTGPKYQYGPYGLHMPGPAYEAGSANLGGPQDAFSVP
jgi:hypothetical protein